MQITINAFESGIIAGQVTGTSDRPVRLKLFANDLQIASHWGIPSLDGRIQTFRFNLSAIWQYLGPETAFRISTDEASVDLPSPTFAGTPKYSFDDLRDKFAAGHVFNEKGGLQLSKTVDVDWQNRMFRLYDEMRAILELRGVSLIAMYGTLLGAFRGGDFIGHDHDFDAGYISQHTDPLAARNELVEVAEVLSRRGFNVVPKGTCIWITDPETEVTIDVFHMFFDKSGKLQLPFGVCGKTPYRRKHFTGYEDVKLAGRSVKGVSNTDVLLEYIYGPHWRTPNPGHNWSLDRTEHNSEGRPSQAEKSKIYWTNHYLHNPPSPPSSFALHVANSRYLRRSIVDFGCGSGGDLHYFSMGRAVVGIDNCSSAIAASRRLLKTHTGGFSNTLMEGDFCNLDLVRRAVEKARKAGGKGRTTYYARFLLHSISADEVDKFFANVADTSSTDDTIALEFRTNLDEKLKKALPFRGRRFLDPDSIIAKLNAAGFQIVSDVRGNGLSRFGNEDPHLCRLIGIRSADSH